MIYFFIYHSLDFVTCNGSGIRVHRSLWCDGRPDCLVNHEDELGCKF